MVSSNELIFVEPTASEIASAFGELEGSDGRAATYGSKLQERAKEYSWEAIATE